MSSGGVAMKVEGVHLNPFSVDFEISYDTPTYGCLTYFTAPTSLTLSELYFLEMDCHHFLGGEDKKSVGVVDRRNSEPDVKNNFEFAFLSSQRQLNAPELATAEELFDKGFIRALRMIGQGALASSLHRWTAVDGNSPAVIEEAAMDVRGLPTLAQAAGFFDRIC